MQDKILSYLLSIFPKTATIDQIIKAVEGERKDVLSALVDIKRICVYTDDERLWGVCSEYAQNPNLDIETLHIDKKVFHTPSENKPRQKRHKRRRAHLVSGGIPGGGKKR